MANDVDALVFKNRHEKNLFGTLHKPDGGRPSGPMIVLLSPGVKMRVGPHRLYNRITEEVCKLGFSVFKFDFTGLGDSEGELDRELLAEVYNDTENGAFVEDSEDALNWLESTYGISTFILGGLCGGAITGLLLAEHDRRVKGLISLNMTTTLAIGGDKAKFASSGELASLRKGYIRRLLNPKSWLRLLTFQSDYSTMAKSIGQLFRQRQKPAASSVKREVASGEPPLSNANPLFPPAFFAMAREQRPMLFVFGTADRAYWDWDEKFVLNFAYELEEVDDAFEVHTVDNANHVFSFREWEQQMLSVTKTWISSRFAEHAVAVESSEAPGAGKANA